jgi:glutamate-ammonia-ligase adenylyltransferase
MHRLNKFSEEFVSKFFRLCAEKTSASQFENFLNKAESNLIKYYFTRSSEANLLRILESQFQLNLFLSDVLKYEHYLEILLTISSYSNYLTDILVQNPSYFYWITNTETLNRKPSTRYYNDTISKIDSNFISFTAKVNSLKNFKKKEILRIGIYDYYLNYSLENITKLLSYLANSINKYLFSLCLDEIKRKYNVKKLPQYCLVSLGKLGGGELNYSSDIDLILFTEFDEIINHKYHSNKIYEEAVMLYIRTASQLTEKGDLYRIDFRLRPYGRNSDLVNTISSYLYYYENQSEHWEKQMLIKCSLLAGSKKLYTRFFNYIQEIIFPKTFLTSPIDKLKTLKHSIETNLKNEGNIKLSSGGIRDIEFATQALQLLNGGKNVELREKNTFSALKKLFKHKLISKYEYDNLSSNYILFRRIEHFIQLMNNIQTHLIPDSGENLERISYILGYPNTNSFLEDLNKRKSFNSSFFNQIISPDSEVNNFDNILFKDKRRAQSNLNYLSTGLSQLTSKKFDEATTQSFYKVLPTLKTFLENSSNPDLVLDNFVKLIKTFSIPKYWYDNLNDKKLFTLLLNILEQSTYLFNLLLEYEEIRDLFISRAVFNKINLVELSKSKTVLFKFFSSLQLYLGMISLNEFQKFQTEYFLRRINALIQLEGLEKKYDKNLLILGFGSFASEEMNLFSDIDLVFLVNSGVNYTSAQTDCQKLLNRLRAELNVDVDCRLRPEGKSSQLVWNLDDYLEYIKKRARVWELHSLTKSIVVYGQSKFIDKIHSAAIDKFNSLDEKKIKSELKEIRDKLITSSTYWLDIKKTRGGKIDLNFIIGYLVLKYSNNYPELFKLNFEEKLKFLIANNFQRNILERVRDSYFLISKIEIFHQIITGSKNVKLNYDDSHFETLCKILDIKDELTFYNQITKTLSDNNKIFNEIFL